MRAWLLFSVVRVLAFAVPFAVLFAIGIDWWIAALVAAAIGFCVSYIFLRPLRDRVALQLANARAGASTAATAGTDEDVEDAPRS